MPATFDPISGTLTFVGGADDDQAGIRLRVDGDEFDRVVFLFDGTVAVGDGTEEAAAALDSAGAAAFAAIQDAVGDLVSNANEATALNATFSDTEAETALNALAVKVNAIIDALQATP